MRKELKEKAETLAGKASDAAKPVSKIIVLSLRAGMRPNCIKRQWCCK
jgi:hypothetical protein